MKRPYRHLVVVMLGVIVCSACGENTPAPSTGAKFGSAPAPAPDASTQSPQVSRPAADVQADNVDPDAGYDRGAALAAAGRFTEARQVFTESMRNGAPVVATS